jgi:hypothetical protein
MSSVVLSMNVTINRLNTPFCITEAINDYDPIALNITHIRTVNRK